MSANDYTEMGLAIIIVATVAIIAFLAVQLILYRKK